MLSTSLLLALVAVAAPARASGSHPFGLGLVVGEPTGLTAKLYLDQPFALQLGLGWVDNFHDDTGLHVNVDFLWHPAMLTRQPAFNMPFYVGVGGRLLNHRYYYTNQDFDHDTHLGVRVPFGILMDFTRVPLDVYLEVAVVVDLIYFDDGIYNHDHNRVDVNGGLGVRYYF